mmetsp:Transcript_36557/g.84015  ORF Transcript_36557/g.84015 Transcript_36557/m.84015 type:complete len:296 (+) Transcript_36557:865-1752(+)
MNFASVARAAEDVKASAATSSRRSVLLGLVPSANRLVRAHSCRECLSDVSMVLKSSCSRLSPLLDEFNDSFRTCSKLARQDWSIRSSENSMSSARLDLTSLSFSMYCRQMPSAMPRTFSVITWKPASSSSVTLCARDWISPFSSCRSELAKASSESVPLALTTLSLADSLCKPSLIASTFCITSVQRESARMTWSYKSSSAWDTLGEDTSCTPGLLSWHGRSSDGTGGTGCESSAKTTRRETLTLGDDEETVDCVCTVSTCCTWTATGLNVPDALCLLAGSALAVHSARNCSTSC